MLVFYTGIAYFKAASAFFNTSVSSVSSSLNTLAAGVDIESLNMYS